MLKKYLRKVRTLCKMIINTLNFIVSLSKLKKLRNSQKEQRCFIIGNGPSLKVEDLEKLQYEKTFSSHRIYKIYNATSWRPTYYCAQDYNLVLESKADFEKTNEASMCFLGRFPRFRYPKIKGFLNLRLKGYDSYPDFPDFSEDISKYIIEGGTVTYMCLQIAVYMGFKEIYLLGVDHNYSVTMDAQGNVKRYNGVKDHFSEDDNLTNIPVLYKSTKAYEKARIYAEAHGVKIYNATRGGKLEVFERVNFDSLDF